jgi:hypothetical protein
MIDIVENDTPQVETPVEDNSTEIVEKSTGTPDPQPKGEPAEPVFEVDGEKLTASEIKKLQENYGRDSKWVEKNEERAKVIKAREQELAPLLALKPYLDQRPEILQQLLQPKQERNIDAELDQLYNQKPTDPYDLQNMALWERQKDILIAQKIATNTQKELYQQNIVQQAVVHNDEIYKSAQDKYRDKVNDSEFYEMTEYIKSNYLPNQGKYSKNVYDRAYKELYEDKWLRDIKLETSKEAIKPLLKTTTSTKDNGIKVSKTDDDDLTPQERKLVEFMKSKNSR